MENIYKQQKEWDISEAKKTLTEIEAMKVLIKNNELACIVEIAGMSIGLCNNSTVLPALEHNENEINKFLNGEPNEWE